MPPQYLPKTLTDEQKAVLASTARITVVRACPGAGKTEVFAEAIRQRLAHWKERGDGLAALSFTNIARETIESRVGGNVQPPHFVGTLDSFVFRFIVKPFGHLVGLPAGSVRLIPAAVSDHLEEPSIAVGHKNHERASMFSVHFCGIAGKNPLISARIPKIGKFDVPADLVTDVLKRKQNYWKGTGIVTHSDCHFLASCILHHKEHSAQVRELIARRFPMIFIDELQDIGCFLGRAFVALFAEARVSGIVVGDPNQAIYGFGGASPSVFDDFEKLSGAVPLSLTVSQRCPKIVAQIATALCASGAQVNALPSADNGKATILVHNLDEPRFNPLQAQHVISLLNGVSLAVISRKSSTVRLLKGEHIRDEFKGKSKSARRINLAVQHLLNGEPRDAAQLIERELFRVVLDDECASSHAVEDRGITKAKWRAAIFSVLASAAASVKGETWNQWVERVKGTVKKAATSVGWIEDSARLRSYMKCKTDGEALRETLLDVGVSPLWNGTKVTTIHKAKGAEFDTVVFFAAKPHKSHAPCPSVEWWSDENGGEERRIAFVAVSRAKQRLVICIHTSTFDALKKLKPDFLKCFQDIIALPSAK